jgi:hypothetical protein
MNILTKRSLIAGIIGLPILGVCMLPALADPSTDPKPAPNAQPGDHKDGDRPGPGGPGGRGERGERGERSQWVEKYRQELREHPRLARSIVALHETKEYLEKSPNDLGGHKASAIKACDEALKELKEAMKFDPKREPPADRGDRPGRGNGKDKDKQD